MDINLTNPTMIVVVDGVITTIGVIQHLVDLNNEDIDIRRPTMEEYDRYYNRPEK